MKVIHQFFWLLFIVALVVLFVQDLYVASHVDGYNILGLELADANKGASMLKSWNATLVDTQNVLQYARLNTLIDFLFIIGYAGVLIIVSNHLLQRERNRHLNELLRLCFPLAILAGLLDVMENAILLFDMHHYQPGRPYYPSLYVSYPKWVLSGLVLIIWLVSLVNKLFLVKQRNGNKK